MELDNTKDVAEREEQGSVIHLRGETGELLFDEVLGEFEGEGEDKTPKMRPIELCVVGSYSKTYKAARAEQRAENQKMPQRARRDPDVLDEQEMKVHAACVKPRNFGPFTVQGQPFEHSRKHVIALFKQAPWIREQAEEAIYDHKLFSIGSAES